MYSHPLPSITRDRLTDFFSLEAGGGDVHMLSCTTKWTKAKRKIFSNWAQYRPSFSSKVTTAVPLSGICKWEIPPPPYFVRWKWIIMCTSWVLGAIFDTTTLLATCSRVRKFASGPCEMIEWSRQLSDWFADYNKRKEKRNWLLTALCSGKPFCI